MRGFFQSLETGRRLFPILGTFLAFSASAAPPEAAYRVHLTVSVFVTNATDVRLDVLLPRSFEGIQRIANASLSPKPATTLLEDGLTYARYFWPRPAASNRVELSFETELLGSPASGPALLAKPTTNDLRAERFIESDAPEIQRLAQGLPGRGDEQRARAVLTCVTNLLAEGPFDPDERGAVEALKRGRGDCSDFSDVFIALCRAAGIPARSVQGYLLTPPRPGDTQRHDWAEVWLRGQGWVHVDPFHIELGHGRFGVRPPCLLRLDTHRANPVLMGYHGYRATARGDGFDVADAITAERIHP